MIMREIVAEIEAGDISRKTVAERLATLLSVVRVDSGASGKDTQSMPYSMKMWTGT